jgi:hypothetical protein
MAPRGQLRRICKRSWRFGGFVQLQWFKGASREWSLLTEVDPHEVDGYGVLAIWAGGLGRASVVLYVGHGQLRQQIEECRRDPIFRGTSPLRVTWAKVDPCEVDGVAAYLYQQLRPLWGEIPRAVAPRPVNLPLTALS